MCSKASPRNNRRVSGLQICLLHGAGYLKVRSWGDDVKETTVSDWLAAWYKSFWRPISCRILELPSRTRELKHPCSNSADRSLGASLRNVGERACTLRIWVRNWLETDDIWESVSKDMGLQPMWDCPQVVGFAALLSLRLHVLLGGFHRRG